MRLLVSIVALGLAGCAVQNVYDSPTQKHTLKIAPHEYAPLGTVSGKECRNQVMQVFLLESPSMQGAVLEARAQRPGTDLVIDKHIYSGGETIIPFFWSKRCIYVEGMAVHLSKGVKR
jgi:hypothetical protein